jgi:hypothetical protein
MTRETPDKETHSNKPAEDAAWARKAVAVRSPVGAFTYGVRARASMISMETAMQHAKVLGQLMDVAAETIVKMHRAEDLARTTAVRQELGPQLYDNEVSRQLNEMMEDQHVRELASRRRTRELVQSDTETLLVEQNRRAKEKFEPLKHMIGEERFKAEAARRKVGTAEAFAAMAEAGHPAEPVTPDVSSDTAPRSREGMVSDLLQTIRAQIRELRADDGDPELRARLIAEEEVLERMLADLLKGK